MLGSNNYLGLTGDERVRQGARDALDQLRHRPHRLALPERHHAAPRRRSRPSSPSGWGPRRRSSSRPATAPTPARSARSSGPSDTVICDSADHASIMDGVRLSGAKLRPFRHNQMPKLERMLERAAADGGGVLVIVDGVFSMEGDLADLPTICDLCERYGARLMVDEAHGVGVLGARGAGASELFGVEDRVDLRMGTFSKSLASCGGFIAGLVRRHRLHPLQLAAVHLHGLGRPRRGRRGARGAARRALRGPRADGARPRERRLPPPAASASSASQVDRPGQAARRDGGIVAGRPRRRRRGLAGRPFVEGALRRGRLHQRRDPPRGPAGRRPPSHLADGDP